MIRLFPFVLYKYYSLNLDKTKTITGKLSGMQRDPKIYYIPKAREKQFLKKERLEGGVNDNLGGTVSEHTNTYNVVLARVACRESSRRAYG